MNLIFRYLEMISRYQEMISRYPEISRITDIGKSGSSVELPHLAFITDDDEVATVVPPRLKLFRPKSIRPNAVHTLFLLMSSYKHLIVSTTWNIRDTISSVQIWY